MQHQHYMNQAEYAAHRKALGLAGGTPAAVLKAIRTHRIDLINGKIDPAVADIQWENRTRKHADLHADRPAATVPVRFGDATSGSSGHGYGDAKARHEAAQADLKELELAKRTGELTDKAAVERAAFAFGRILQKSLIDVFPSKISMEAVTLTDPWAFECFLRDHLRKELTAISSIPVEEIDPPALPKAA